MRSSPKSTGLVVPVRAHEEEDVLPIWSGRLEAPDPAKVHHTRNLGGKTLGEELGVLRGRVVCLVCQTMSSTATAAANGCMHVLAGQLAGCPLHAPQCARITVLAPLAFGAQAYLLGPRVSQEHAFALCLKLCR